MAGKYIRSRLPGARVGSDVVEATEHLECWVTFDAVLLAEIGLLGAVDFDERNVLFLQSGGSLLVLWSQSLAVAAPRCKDFELWGQ